MSGLSGNFVWKFAVMMMIGVDRLAAIDPANQYNTTFLMLQTINRRSCTIMEKATSSTFTFKTLLSHYAKQTLDPW